MTEQVPALKARQRCVMGRESNMEGGVKPRQEDYTGENKGKGGRMNSSNERGEEREGKVGERASGNKCVHN